MTKERLQKLSTDSLIKIALNEGIKHIDELSREDLVEQLLEAMEEDRAERESSNNFAIRIEEKKYNIVQDEELEAQEKTEYCIPEKYQETTINLLLRDPYWAYAFWDIRDSDLEPLKKKQFRGLLLRVNKIDRKSDGDAKGVGDSFEIPVKNSDNNWYINLPECGYKYYIELVGKYNGGETVLARSNTIESPVYTITDSLREGNITDVSDSMLAFAGIFEQDTSANSQTIPQRIIQFIDATNNFNFKS